MRVQRSARLIVIGSLALAACTSDNVPTPTTMPPGGTLRVGVLDTNACGFTLCGGAWDPQVSYVNLHYELGRCCLLRSLLSFNGRPTGEGGSIHRPDLAEALPEISPDGLSWTFHLREGLTYAPPLETTPIVASDLVRSIERALGPRPAELGEWWGEVHDHYVGSYLNLANIIQGGGEYMEGGADRISGLETPDDHTLIVRLEQPSGTLATLLSMPDLAPIPPDPTDPSAPFGIADGYPYGPTLVASGPYMVEGASEIDLDVPVGDRGYPTGYGAGTLTLVRNPSWSADDDPLRVAAADRIVLVRVPDQQAGIELVSTGDLDLLWDWRSSDADVAAARDLPGVHLESVSRDTIRYLRMNVAMPPFDDVHVRRAAAFAIDRAAAELAYAEHGVQSDPALHVGLDSQEDNLLANFDPFAAASGPDLDAARTEMALSSYDRDHDGTCDADACAGFDFPLLRPVDDFTRGTMLVAEGIVEDLENIGLRPRIRLVDDFNLLFDHEAHIAMAVDAWAKDGTTSASWFAPLFGSGDLNTTGDEANLFLLGATPKQLSDWRYETRSVPSVDDRIRTCLGLAFQAQTQCWAELDRFLTEEVVPMVPLVVEVQTNLVSDRVTTYWVDQSAAFPIAALDQLVVPPGEVDVPTPAPAGMVPEIPSGTYEMTVTEDDVVQTVPDATEEDIGFNTGRVRLVVDGEGGWYLVQQVQLPDSPFVVTGTYSAEGRTGVVFRAEANGFNAFEGSLLGWEMEGDELRLTMRDCRTPDEVFCAFLEVSWTAHPWRRME